MLYTNWQSISIKYNIVIYNTWCSLRVENSTYICISFSYRKLHCNTNSLEVKTIQNLDHIHYNYIISIIQLFQMFYSSYTMYVMNSTYIIHMLCVGYLRVIFLVTTCVTRLFINPQSTNNII